jgi:hypothetical protein
MIGNAKSHRKVTVHSRLLRRGSCDGRSREGRFLAAVRAELREMVGGDPTPAERTVIERACWVRLHLALIDERVAGGAVLSAHDQRSYTAYTSTLVTLLRQLRLLQTDKPAIEPEGPRLAELMALGEAERRARATAA